VRGCAGQPGMKRSTGRRDSRPSLTSVFPHRGCSTGYSRVFPHRVFPHRYSRTGVARLSEIPFSGKTHAAVATLWKLRGRVAQCMSPRALAWAKSEWSELNCGEIWEGGRTGALGPHSDTDEMTIIWACFRRVDPLWRRASYRGVFCECIGSRWKHNFHHPLLPLQPGFPVVCDELLESLQCLNASPLVHRRDPGA